MAMISDYRPSDLAYYTTWWLKPKSFTESQTSTSSVRNSMKSNDEWDLIQHNINQDEIQSFCCIPIKKFRRQ